MAGIGRLGGWRAHLGRLPDRVDPPSPTQLDGASRTFFV
jgi:hypothetical protein